MQDIAQTVKTKTTYLLQAVKRNTSISFLIKVSPILAFTIPFIILYCLDITLYHLNPTSFEATWKGRTYYLFFIWLVFLETILSWEELSTNKINKLSSSSARIPCFIIFLLLPTIYVLIANFLGLNSAISHLYVQYVGPEYEWFAQYMPLSVEYLIFGSIFAIIQVLMYGKKGLTNFSISASLLFAIGMFYTIDSFFPWGRIAPLQWPALPTTVLAARVLNLWGYRTMISTVTDPKYGWMPYLAAYDPKNFSRYAGFGIGWPCAGIDSLLLYTITILLFLKKSDIPLWQRTVYFMFGAIVTYVINIWRIATIFVVAIDTGVNSLQTQRFHEYYGPLYSMMWITFYPLMMIGSLALWRMIKKPKTD